MNTLRTLRDFENYQRERDNRLPPEPDDDEEAAAIEADVEWWEDHDKLIMGERHPGQEGE